MRRLFGGCGEQQRRALKHKYRLAMRLSLSPMPGDPRVVTTRPISISDTGIAKSYLFSSPHRPISRAPDRACSGHKPDGARHGSHSKGDGYVQDRFCTEHAGSIGCRIDPDADTTCCSSRRMRPRRLPWTVWFVPPVRDWTLSGWLQRPVSQRLSLERLPCRRLARSVGTLPRHALSWPPAQRHLEVLSCLTHRAGWLVNATRPARLILN